MMTHHQKIGAVVAIWLVAGSLFGYVMYRDAKSKPVYEVPTFEDELPSPGSPAATATPPVFDDEGTEDHSDLIRVDSPKSGDTISSPLTIKGFARGNWYFEASFPVRLEDGNGKILAQHYAQADSDWMTTEFVPFTSKFSYDQPTSPTGTLILMKDNPSGLPEHDDEIRLLVRFDMSQQVAGGCKPTGCSGQVCSDEDVITDCQYREEYSCYKEPGVRCERQANGSCGWTQSVDLVACLNDKAQIK